MHKEIIEQRVDEILKRCKKVCIENEVTKEQQEHFSDVTLYLVDKNLKNELLELGKDIGESEAKKDISKVLYPYVKIINATIPAFKYSFFVKKRAVEVFDPEKVKKMLLGEAERYKNKERVKLKQVFKESPSPLSEEEQRYLTKELEDRLSIDGKMIQEVYADFDAYSVVITNHAHCSVYPSLYYTLDLTSNVELRSVDAKKKDYKKENTHLRIGVPNFLWFEETRAFAELRANNKIDQIIRTHQSFFETIYIQKRK